MKKNTLYTCIEYEDDMSELFTNLNGYDYKSVKSFDAKSDKKDYSEVDFCTNVPEDNFFTQECFDVDFCNFSYDDFNNEKEYTIDQYKRDSEYIESDDSTCSWEC